jgi:hypothetical protein
VAADINKAIMGRKIGMTQIFDENDKAVPVTIVEAGPCTVLQKKNSETDGYSAIQVGFYNLKEKQVNKPARGHFKKANVKPLRFIKEFRVKDIDAYEIGQELKADLFNPGDIIDVVGTSKGKGFAGAVKRHNFARGSMGHDFNHITGFGFIIFVMSHIFLAGSDRLFIERMLFNGFYADGNSFFHFIAADRSHPYFPVCTIICHP